MILKTSGSTESLTQLRKGGIGVGSDSRAGCGGSELNRIKVHGGKIRDNVVGKKVQKSSKSKNLSKFKKTIGSDFFTPGAKLKFPELRQIFVKIPILYHFDLECHIWIKTDVLSYAIGKVLSQLALDDLG